jgi:hypothetical protein
MGKGEPRDRRPHGRGPFRPALEKGIVERILLLRPRLLILPMNSLALGLPHPIDAVAGERPIDGIDRLAHAVALGQFGSVRHCISPCAVTPDNTGFGRRPRDAPAAP